MKLHWAFSQEVPAFSRKTLPLPDRGLFVIKLHP
jgi:hypothetical protein